MGIYTGHINVLFKPIILQGIQHLKGWQAAYNGYWHRNERVINAMQNSNKE